MSVNIQTPAGLLKISGDRVTKENINKALGYTPANVEALPKITDDASDSLIIADAAGNIATSINGEGIKTIEDVTIQTATNTYSVVDHIEHPVLHVTAEERLSWNSKSDFSGNYTDLIDRPDIIEDNSGMIQVADNSGNIILQVDEYGVTTHDVTVNGSIESVATHHNNTTTHITETERTKWDNKSDFSGNYTDLIGEPNITEDESSELNITDASGNIIATVSANGIESHEFIVSGVELGNQVIRHDTLINTLQEYVIGDKTLHTDVIPLIDNVHNHVNDTVNHISSVERDNWNSAKETVDTINSDYVTRAEFGSLSSAVSNHATDSTAKLHITAQERTRWNNKSDFSGNYTDLTGEPNIQEDESAELTIVDESGNIIFRVDSSGVRTFNVVLGSDQSSSVDVTQAFKDIQRMLVEVGDLSEVTSTFITDYTTQADGSALAVVDVQMFETFLIHDPDSVYNVSITYDEWAGVVADYRILAENTGSHIIKVTRNDGVAITEDKLDSIDGVVEHIKNGFSVYFNKLHKILTSFTTIDETQLDFDTTQLVLAE